MIQMQSQVSSHVPSMVRFAAQSSADEKPNHTHQPTSCFPVPENQQPNDNQPVKPLEQLLTDLSMRPAAEVTGKLSLALDVAKALTAEAKLGWPTLKNVTNPANLLENLMNLQGLLGNRTGKLLNSVLEKVNDLLPKTNPNQDPSNK